jgi:tetratricopeptide (TPR) repeat protein
MYAAAVRDTTYSEKFTESLKLAIEAIAAVEGLPPGRELAALLHQAGQAYFFAGDPEQARPLCRQAFALAEHLGELEIQADVLCTLGLIFMNNHPEQALASFQEAIELAEAHGYIWTASRAHNNLGLFLFEQWGDLRSALPHFERAVEIVRKLGFSEEELFFLHNIALCYLKAGDLADADEIHPVIDKLLAEVADPTVHGPNQRFYQGFLLGLRGQWRKALALQREALREARNRGDLYIVFDVSTASLVPLLLDMHQFLANRDLQEADSILKEALDIGKKALFVGGIVAPNCLLSAIRSRQRQLEQARRLLDEARAVFDRTPSYRSQGILAFAQAELNAAGKLWPETMDAYQALVNLMKESGQSWEEARACLYWADACVARGELDDSERARQLYRRALDLFSEIGAPGYAKVAKQRLSALISEQGESFHESDRIPPAL